MKELVLVMLVCRVPQTERMVWGSSLPPGMKTRSLAAGCGTRKWKAAVTGRFS